MIRARLAIAALGLLIMGACDQQAAPDSTPVPEQAMVYIEGASFRIGSAENELESIAATIGLGSTRPLAPEVPAHDVTVDDFYIDRYDVTNKAFFEFVSDLPEWRKDALDAGQQNGRYLEHWVNGQPAEQLLNHPVVFVTWHAAVAFCDWQGKRLPTEPEFEWAAQSGDGPGEYPWGVELPDDDRVNWGANGIDTTVPVGSYPPNPRGLYDMSGNVWHFTATPWLGTYAEALADPEAVAAAVGDPGVRRVVRGGSFGANAANLRVRYRDSHRPYDAREMVGFRCARSAD